MENYCFGGDFRHLSSEFFYFEVGFDLLYQKNPAEYAPGCLSSGIPGGCFGKTMITDLRVDPKIPCLIIRANNCSGGQLEVINDCMQNVTIAGLTIPWQQSHEYVEEAAIKLIINGSNLVQAIDLESATGQERNAVRDKTYDSISTSGSVGRTKFTLLQKGSSISISPQVSCLSFESGYYAAPSGRILNPILIKNLCSEPVMIAGIKIANYKREETQDSTLNYIELIKNASGQVVASKSNSYIPKEDELLTATGKIGDQQFIISYIKTKPLCR